MSAADYPGGSTETNNFLTFQHDALNLQHVSKNRIGDEARLTAPRGADGFYYFQ
jgi:hypothetical protein